MPTQKQIAASRANGARSKGPVTEIGKLHSSRNSARHGLLARTVVLEEECVERFHELIAVLTDEYQPRTSTELTLVETMAVARWRQLRIWGMQKTALDRGMALQNPDDGPPAVRAVLAFRDSPDSSCAADLLLRYEIAFDRQFTRALACLTTLQSKPAPHQPYHPGPLVGHTWKDLDVPKAPPAQPLSEETLPVRPHQVVNAERTQEPVENPGAVQNIDSLRLIHSPGTQHPSADPQTYDPQAYNDWVQSLKVFD
jgi:hypothetical protein